MANRKRNVSYVTQEEPAFLTKFKERVGYKEGPGIDAKFKTPNFDSDDDMPEMEEEQPQVVVLKKGDLTSDEAAGLSSGTGDSGANNSDDAASGDTGGRIMFKKPIKRSTDAKTSLSTCSSSKKSKDSDKNTETDTADKKHSKSKTKKNKNTKLLSFDDDDEDS